VNPGSFKPENAEEELKTLGIFLGRMNPAKKPFSVLQQNLSVFRLEKARS